MATEKQIAANRANALKSTGPRTPAGKARSSRNACKHGMAGDAAGWPQDELRQVERTVADWVADLGASGPVERTLASLAARSATRIERLERAEWAGTLARVWRARALHDGTLAREAELVAATLGADPAQAVQLLTRTASGCDWLLARWDELRRALEANGSWTFAQLQRAYHLLGHRAAEVAQAPWSVRLRECYLALHPSPHPEEFFELIGGRPDHYVDPDQWRTKGRQRWPEPEAARSGLLGVIDAEAARLAGLKSGPLEDEAALERALAPELALVDTTAAGSLIHRYRSAAERGLHRALAGLLQLREARQAADEDDAPSPAEPAPAPAPNEPKSGPAPTPIPAPAPAPPLAAHEDSPSPSSSPAPAPATPTASSRRAPIPLEELLNPTPNRPTRWRKQVPLREQLDRRPRRDPDRAANTPAGEGPASPRLIGPSIPTKMGVTTGRTVGPRSTGASGGSSEGGSTRGAGSRR